MGKTGRGVVVPFPGGGVWAVQRFGCAETEQLAMQIIEELDRAEEAVKVIEAALQGSNEARVADERERQSWRGREHPSELALERFLRGQLSRAEVLTVVRHLLTGCPQCRRVTGVLWCARGNLADRAQNPASLQRRAGALPVI